MQILGASIDLGTVVQQAGDLFLHAGYISAYPRTFVPSGYAEVTPSVEVDLVEAFRLQTEGAVAAAQSAASDSMAGVVSSGGGSIWPTVVAVAAFFGVLVATWFYRERLARAGAGARALLILMMAGSFLPLITCSEEPSLPDEAPWTGVQVREYADPESATLALLNGIILDGIANVDQPIESLANIQNEVGLPTATPTEGMEYALSTYGLDGWGREFRLTAQADGKYEVRSAGADGQISTADDLSITVAQCDKGDWDYNRTVFFVTKHEGTPVLLFHRWSGDLFKYNNEKLGKAITGDVLFDAIDTSLYGDEMKSKAQEVYAAYSAEHQPLVLQVIPDAYFP